MAAEKDNDTRTNAQSPGLESRTHTPGPWRAFKPADSNGYVDVVGERNGATEEVCTCYQIDSAETTARLIAAAPELLENCKIMLSRIEAILQCSEALDGLLADDAFGDTYQELIEADARELKSAISKAE